MHAAPEPERLPLLDLVGGDGDRPASARRRSSPPGSRSEVCVDDVDAVFPQIAAEPGDGSGQHQAASQRLRRRRRAGCQVWVPFSQVFDGDPRGGIQVAHGAVPLIEVAVRPLHAEDAMIELLRVHGPRKRQQPAFVAAEEQFIDQRNDADLRFMTPPTRSYGRARRDLFIAPVGCKRPGVCPALSGRGKRRGRLGPSGRCNRLPHRGRRVAGGHPVHVRTLGRAFLRREQGTKMSEAAYPEKQGLYDPPHEHDACGVGFVVDIKGRKSHDIVQQGARGPGEPRAPRRRGCEKNTGDGAGILLQMPHGFLAEGRRRRSASQLPAPGQYGVGMVFLPPTESEPRTPASACSRRSSREEGQRLLGWRDVPTDNGSARRDRPGQPAGHPPGVHRARRRRCADEAAFERKLYVIRRLVEKTVCRSAIPQRGHFYVPQPLAARPSSTRGCCNAGQLRRFYPDLQRPGRRVGAGDGPLALLAPTPSRAGRARIRTATSRTTARSTRCAATSTGCTRARR